MGHGNPVCFDEHLKPVSGLGIDCHSVCSAYIPGQMNLVLQWARARRHEELEAKGKWSKTVEYSVRDVYNFGTIQGARVIGMESQIGSLSVGKKADIVIFDTESPGMAVAADRDPLAAIVLHSSIRDVETVIIDGIVRKQRGRLDSVKLPVGIDSSSEGETVTWKTVLGRVAGLAKEVDERKKAIDPEVAENGVLQAFYMNTAARC
jgi:formylmethanofuran dehydrogenase subunit A